MLEKLNTTVEFIKKIIGNDVEIGIILGTGLGGLVKEIVSEHEIDYKNIPNFPISTVEGHSGKLIIGKLAGKRVVAMQGRFHYYEGYKTEESIFPVRVMKCLGIKYLFVSNASGGVNPNFEIGDLMIITDHINLIPNPLIGKHTAEFGARFPDMGHAYDPELVKLAKYVSSEIGYQLQEGVYLATTGPTYETPAEYKYFRIVGADAVGMSTAPEIIVARQMKIPCFAMSIITDLGVPEKIVEITHEEVQKVANLAEAKMTKIFSKMIERL
ncbi:MAG: purine-nucleoside phosphorylase [Bacteroidales bacterium]|jgi:purine-nucleoside phosphorylase|nr:purine-nucleoside phosphorylase [Bacteroidales bacterium]